MSTPPPRECAVVVVALAGGEALQACLIRLAPWHNRCVVMLGEDMEGVESWRARFPDVRFIDGRGLAVPVRRQRGLEATQGEVVAFLEDTSLPEPGWTQALCEAFADDGVAAAAGPVLLDPGLDARTRALACTEYGRFHPDLFPRLALGPADGRGVLPVQRLPGNNLAYRRAPLLQLLKDADSGVFEIETNESLKARGMRLACHPAMAVRYRAADPQGARLGTRLRHGRLFAGRRCARWPLPARLAMVLGSLLLPFLLSARTLAAMTHAVGGAAWPATGIWICLMESAWAAGECLGYLAGPGRSVEAWR